MRWTHLQEEPTQELQKQKISFLGERAMNNVWVVAGKEEYPKDPSKRMEQGKSSHASSAENLVTLHVTVDRNNMEIEVHNMVTKGKHMEISLQHVPGKPKGNPYEVQR
jgi:hypothetical protein